MFAIFYGRGFAETSRIHAQIDVAMRDHLHEFNNGKNMNALGVFLKIALHANESGWAWPSREEIKSKTGLSTEHALSAALKHLRNMTIDGQRVFAHYRVQEQGRWGRSAYLIFPDLPHGEPPFPHMVLYSLQPVQPHEGDPHVGEPHAGDPQHKEEPKKEYKHSEIPNAKAKSLPEISYVDIDDEFEDRPQVSELSAFIGQQMHSPVSAGNQKKLAMTYTEFRKTGKVVHASPDHLWNTGNRVYRDFIDSRIEFWKGQPGSPAQRRNKLVNQICNYLHTYGWLRYSMVAHQTSGDIYRGDETEHRNVEPTPQEFIDKLQRTKL